MDEVPNQGLGELGSWSEVVGWVIESCDMFGDAQTRLVYVVNGILSRLGATAGTLTLLEQPSGSGSIRLVRMLDVGTWSPRERGARQRYFNDPDHATDPLAARFAERDFREGPCCCRRQDLLTDEEWYGSQHVQVLRRQANQDAVIYVCSPLPSGLITGISINRAWGQPQFTESERDYAFAVLVSLSPLFERAWLEPARSSDYEMDHLPLRLRKVLGCLMAGDSEKLAAAKLGLSQQTVHTYIKQLYERYQVHSRGELLARVLTPRG